MSFSKKRERMSSDGRDAHPKDIGFKRGKGRRRKRRESETFFSGHTHHNHPN